METRRSVRIVNASGLHARPCHAIVSTALGFESEFRVSNGEHAVNGKSILELMTLNAPHGTVLELSAQGQDASALLERVAALVEAGFGETD